MVRREKDQITAHLSADTRAALGAILYLDAVDSTNTYLLNKASQGAPNMACFAETQTAGRGQQGRQWFSPPHCNIYLSVLWHFLKLPPAFNQLSVVMAEAVIKTLQNLGIQKALQLKAPNDILYENQKLCGILIDSILHADGSAHVVIGVGLNVYAFEDPSGLITQPWTTVEALSDTPVVRERLSALLLDQIVLSLGLFESQKAEGRV
jgi:BirA family biotin operon repressor/biotin-[acetyl-CoA-carboxylase] ligase